MSKVPSIGAGVITTDDVLAQGYDFVPLFQGGMAKVPADVAAAQSKDITGAAYTKPAALSLTTDLTATKTVAEGAILGNLKQNQTALNYDLKAVFDNFKLGTTDIR